MNFKQKKDSAITNSWAARRNSGALKPISISQEGLIARSYLNPGQTLPLVIQPAIDRLNLLSWAKANREFIESELLKHGAILFRNFNLIKPEEFEQFIAAISGELLQYRERSSPRSHVTGNIYTSTDHPASQSIFLHNENSYQQVWPLKIFFFCATAPQSGGETPIADCRKIFERIDPRIRQHFTEKGWMYTRNFGEGFGLPWQTVFQTSDKTAVEEHCRKNGIELKWREGNCLRTSAIRAAVAKHPRTGEMTWFNHATFFNISTLSSLLQEALLAEFKEDELPSNTYYGDGSRIEPEVLEMLRDAYHQETIRFPWQQGDILVLDNMLTAHGRAPYSGPRKILVGMSEPISTRGL